MKKSSRAVFVGVVATALVSLSVLPAGARSSSRRSRRPPRSASPSSEIHIAVIADVDNPFAPGLVQGRGRRREGGRRVPEQQGGRRWSRRAQGRRRLLRLEAQPQRVPQRHHHGVPERPRDGRYRRAVPDLGRATWSTARTRPVRPPGCPTSSSVTTGVPETCAPISFPAIGAAIDCATVTQNPQTFYGNQGPAKWLLSQHKGGLHGPMLVVERHEGRQPRRHDPRPHGTEGRHQGRPGHHDHQVGS